MRINCRQPFGTIEHRACIGLAYINFSTCKPRASQLSKSENGTDGAAKRKVPSEVLRSGTEGKHQKKSKQKDTANLEYQNLNVKPEPQDYALPLESPQIPGIDSSISKMKIRQQSPDGKEFVEERKPSVGKGVKQETVVEKVMKPKLVIGMEAATTDPTQYQAFRLASSPLPRKEGSVSKMKSRNHIPDRNDIVCNRKPKIEDIQKEVVLRLQATKGSDNNVQSSPCILDRTRKNGKTENVDIGVNAAQEVGKSEHVRPKRCGVAAQAPPHTKLNSAQELGKAGRARLEGPAGSSSNETTAGNEDFGEVLVRPWIVT